MGGTDMDDMDIPAGMGATATNPLGSDTGDVDHPLYLINGQPPEMPQIVDVEPGERLRLRLINVGSDTAFRVAVGGVQLNVIQTDGRPVVPVDVDAVLLGMGERYDVLVTVPEEGVFPVVADAEGKDGQAMVLLRSGPGELPPPDVRPDELSGRLLTYDALQADPTVSLGDGSPDRTYRVRLTGDMAAYEWGVEPDIDDGRERPRSAHGQRDRRPHGADHGRLHRRQPRPMGVALPQHLPRGSWHADGAAVRPVSQTRGEVPGAPQVQRCTTEGHVGPSLQVAPASSFDPRTGRFDS